MGGMLAHPLMNQPMVLETTIYSTGREKKYSHIPYSIAQKPMYMGQVFLKHTGRKLWVSYSSVIFAHE